MNRDFKDTSSDWISRAIDILFCTHPKRTSLGFVVGALIYVIVGVLFAPVWTGIQWVKLSSLKLWHYLIVGLSVMHIPTVRESYSKDSELPKEIEQALCLIKDAEKNGVPKNAIKNMRLELCNSLVKSLSIKPEKGGKNSQQRN
ncbi:hypothetical protein CEW91_07880 [Idiomarina piscisalsi]|jgi:hypothetical protein|uniref:Uncharacterized protein n=1 Tax=Idiomarina piscisalsi TaxID=1096243 RepID=A0ABM6LU81_9GAMM|nr:hypothetical protein [Idiomarina piscisalsi]ASG66072.1 hypothetical protein CEW91_07880 [Idiomarina piscisalsi]